MRKLSLSKLLLTLGLTVMFSATASLHAENGKVQMSEAVRDMLESVLSAEQMDAVINTLSAPDAWGSLGPAPTGEPEPLSITEPDKKLRLSIPDNVSGSGTAEDPYIDVLSGFLEQFEYEPTSIEAYQSYPDMDAIEGYMGALDYEPVTVIVPPGHYRETAAVQDSPHRHYDQRVICVDVPPGIWLKADGEVVVHPDVEEGTRGSLINLNIKSGLIGFRLDGSSVPGFEPEPDTRVTGVKAAHKAVIADCHIHDFTNHGILAAGNRGRAASYVNVSNNIIETIGYSGIRGQSGWVIRDNQIRYAGLLRPTGGGGDDAIIPVWSQGGKVVNNLVIMERRPHGRHVISGQQPEGCLVAGNISIVEGSLRNNIGFSDGAHYNRFVGNLSLGTGTSESRIQAGISINGYGNVLEYNVSIGNPRAFRTRGREGQKENIIRKNYGEYTLGGIHRSSFYSEEDNILRRISEAPAPPDPDAFGFFSR